MTTSFPGIRSFYDSFIISRKHFKRLNTLCLFHNTCCNIHCSKLSVIDLRKSEDYCVCLWKTIVELCSFKGAYYSTELVALTFV